MTLKQILEKKKLSQRDFAALMESHQPQIQRWVSGEDTPGGKALKRITEALNCVAIIQDGEISFIEKSKTTSLLAKK